MSEYDRVLLSMQAKHEQDEAECVQWIRQTKPEHRLAVWLAIQRMPNDGGVVEIISRFAQLGITHGELLAKRREANP